MNVLIAFLITITILLVALIKFKISPAVGLFVSAIIMAVLCKMPSAELLGYIANGFGNTVRSFWSYRRNG